MKTKWVHLRTVAGKIQLSKLKTYFKLISDYFFHLFFTYVTKDNKQNYKLEKKKEKQNKQTNKTTCHFSFSELKEF